MLDFNLNITNKVGNVLAIILNFMIDIKLLVKIKSYFFVIILAMK